MVPVQMFCIDVQWALELIESKEPHFETDFVPVTGREVFTLELAV